MRPTAILATALICLLALSAGAVTQAEKLGYRPGDRVLLVHADDVGMCLSTVMGASAAYTRGIVSSMSVMVPCPWLGKAAEFFKSRPNVDMGLHLDLTCEHDYYRWGPVAGKAAVPGLADEWGCLWDNNGLVAKHASADEVETEIRAQIARARAFGIEPTHIDTHMGTLVERADYTLRYYKVGIEQGIPVMAFADLPGENLPPEIATAYRGLLRQAWNAGLPVLDSLVPAEYGWTPEEKKPKYLEVLRNLKPGVHELIVHCAYPSEEIYNINGPSAASRWIADYLAMTDPEVVKAVKDEGIVLTSWRELKERRAKYGKPE